MKPLLATVLCVALAGCSSDTPTDPLPEADPGELVSYQAIAGTWSGWDYTGDFAFRAEFAEEAYKGETAGEFNVFRPTNSVLVGYCSISLRAESADPPLYVFDGTVGSCTSTMLTVRHLTADRLEVSNSQGEAGYLLPGNHPGPPPQ